MLNKITPLFIFIMINTIAIAQPNMPVSEFIKIDQFGYLPNADKVAVISDPVTGFNSGLSFTPGATYEVRQWTDDVVVFSGSPMPWNNGNTHAQSGDRGWWFDFSSVSAAGSYYIYDISNNVQSGRFEIGDDVYSNVLSASVRMFFYNRCNHEKVEPYAAPNWTDALAFTQDNNCRYVLDQQNAALEKDLSGGWFDAGDFNKYITFTDRPMHDLLWAYLENPTAFTDNWNIPESGNGIPDLLDELKWELEWLLKMNNPDGSTHTKVGSRNYSENTQTPPSLNTDTRYYGPTCSSASICVAGTFAQAAKVFATVPGMAAFAQELETSAINSWNYVLPQLTNNTLDTDCDNGEIISGDADWDVPTQKDKALKAAIYLFDLTGDNNYKQYISDNLFDSEQIGTNYWSGYKIPLNDALMHYTTLPGADAADVSAIINSFSASASSNNENFFGFDNADLYRAFMPDYSYHWGSNKPKAGFGLLNLLAVKHNINSGNTSSYQQKAAEVVHYFHGINPMGIVYLSNMYTYGAERSANEIYHQWFGDGSNWDHALNSLYGPAPGYVPGGANAAYSGSYSPPAGQPQQKSYLDYNESSTSNPSWEISEPSITYQGSYVRLLAFYAGATVDCPAAGTSCDDGNSNTTDDVEDGFCNCSGTINCPAAGTPCDDGNADTTDDEEDGNCNCVGTSNCPILGTLCDDDNPNTINDQEDGNCNCIGVPASTDCNFIVNGTFDTGLNPWYSWGSSPTVSNGIALIENITPGANPWDASLSQGGISITQGTTYEVQLDAYAAADRPLNIKVGLSVSPYTEYRYETVNLTTSVQTLSFTFTMTQATTTQAALEFFVGGNTADVWIDNVMMKEADCVEASCPQTLFVTNSVASGLYSAELRVGSDIVIPTGMTVIYRGGESVELGAGFEVELGAEFTGEIGPCGN